MRAKILVIEDHRELRENTCELLATEGFDTLAAENGQEGLEMAIHEKPDLILCDISMPVLDGYSVLAGLRNLTTPEEIPFVFFTAKSESRDILHGLELGACAYIVKPFETELLLKTVHTMLGNRGVPHLQ